MVVVVVVVVVVVLRGMKVGSGEIEQQAAVAGVVVVLRRLLAAANVDQLLPFGGNLQVLVSQQCGLELGGVLAVGATHDGGIVITLSCIVNGADEICWCSQALARTPASPDTIDSSRCHGSASKCGSAQKMQIAEAPARPNKRWGNVQRLRQSLSQSRIRGTCAFPGLNIQEPAEQPLNQVCNRNRPVALYASLHQGIMACPMYDVHLKCCPCVSAYSRAYLAIAEILSPSAATAAAPDVYGAT